MSGFCCCPDLKWTGHADSPPSEGAGFEGPLAVSYPFTWDRTGRKLQLGRSRS